MGYFSPEVSENAFEDALTLGAVLNSDENAIVESRLGVTYPSLAKALYTVIQSGGFEPFTTEAALLASVPTVPKKAAKALDTKKIWYWNGSAWVDTGLSELDLAKEDATTKADIAKSEAITAAANYTNLIGAPINVYKMLKGRTEVQYDANNVLRVLNTTALTGELQSFNPQIAANSAAVQALSTSVVGISAYKKLAGLVQTIVDSNGVMRIVSSTTTGEFVNYSAAKQKTLIAGDGINILETPDNITISTGATAYATPTEFVLCLIIGQSNASYYGGDAALAPSVPVDVCKIWDNTSSVLRELNDSSSTSEVCKQTYAPALALEFYKQTGMGLIIVNSAVGSTAQVAAADNGAGNWSPTGTLRQLAVNRFNACKAYLDTNSYCYQAGFVCWTQGERDGQEIQLNTITKQQYKDGLIEMIDFFKTNLGAKLPFAITTTAYYTSTGDNTGSKAVRAAQLEVGHEKSGVFVGFTGAPKFPARNLMSDNVHYSQLGKNILGTALGKITSKLSAGVN